MKKDDEGGEPDPVSILLLETSVEAAPFTIMDILKDDPETVKYEESTVMDALVL